MILTIHWALATGHFFGPGHAVLDDDGVELESAVDVEDLLPVLESEDPFPLALIEEQAAQRAGAPLTVVGRDMGFDVVSIDIKVTTVDMDLPSFGPVRVTTGLVGEHQAANCATAATALGVLAGIGSSPVVISLDDLQRPPLADLEEVAVHLDPPHVVAG